MIAASLAALLMQPMDVRLKGLEQDSKVNYQYLSQMAFDPEQSIQMRWRAVTTMGRLSPKFFLKDLEKAMVSKEWFVRNAALIAILNQPRDIAVRWSTQLLKDKSLMVRTQAVRNLLGLEATETEPILWQQIWDKRNFRGRESLWVRAHLAEAVARMPTQGRTQSFKKLIMDADPRLHKWAIMGLEKSTGLKLSDRKEPIEIQRQKWLSRLGVEAI